MEPLDGKPTYHVLDTDWYDADTLKDTPVFRDRRATRFSIINAYKLIQGTDFIYTAANDPTEAKPLHDSKADRVLLSCVWVHNLLDLGKRPQDAVVAAPRVTKRARVAEEEESTLDEVVEELDGQEIGSSEEDEPPRMLLSEVPMPDRVSIHMLPLVHLDEEDWFMGLNITFRGERHPDYIYARGPDVAKGMNTRLALKARRSLASSNYITVYEGDQPITYLRYIGLLSLLFTVKQKGLVQKFQTWATRVLFAFQFRPVAGSSMSRIPQSLCKPFFQVAVGELAGFFACWVQAVDALRDDLQIPKELAGGEGRGVYRIAFTGNLSFEVAVLKHHFQTLSPAVTDDLQLVAFAHIDKSLFTAARRDWESMAAALHGNYFQLLTADMGLYVLHDSDIPKIRSLALKLQLRFSSNIEHHIRLEVTNELMTTQQQEMERLRLQCERQMMETERLRLQYERQAAEMRRA